MSKIMVVGAAGFVGSNFCNWLMLHTKHDIVGVDNMSTFPDLLNLEPVIRSKRFDLNISNGFDDDIMERLVGVEKPDYIINATVSGVYGVLLHKCIVGAVENNPVKKIISLTNMHDSFWEAYDTSPESLSEYLNSAAPAIVARVCNLYGPRQEGSRVVPRAIFSLLNGEAPSHDVSTRIQSWMYIKDAFKAVLALLNDGVPGTIYDVDSHYMLSDYGMVNKICDIMGFEHPDFECANKERSVSSLTVDVRELGWEPTLGLEESLEHTICWYNTSKWAYRLD